MLIAVLKEDSIDEVFVHALENTGLSTPGNDRQQGAHIVRCIPVGVESVGYERPMFKPDQEPAMKAVRSKVTQLWGGDIIPQHSAARSSASNAYVERAIREVEAQVWCMLLALQARVKAKFDARWPVMYWLVDYSGELINRFKKDQNCRTAREKKYGKADYIALVEFGEGIFFTPQVHNVPRTEKSKAGGARASSWEVRSTRTRSRQATRMVFSR